MSGYQLGRDAVDGYVWRASRLCDGPLLRTTSGWSSLRECEKCPPDGCDLSCSWPAEAEPLLWEGDDS